MPLDNDPNKLTIPEMYELTDQQYRGFVQDEGIFWIDHHDVLRETVSERPLATTLEQLDILIDELTKARVRMQPRG